MSGVEIVIVLWVAAWLLSVDF